MKYLIFLFLFSLSIPSYAQAPMGEMPHALTKDAGLLRGTLFREENNKKEFIQNEVVALIVFYQGKRVLMLDKKTDSQGHFEFKNIFRDPDYVYALGVMLEDELYVYPDIQIQKDQKVVHVDFPVGPESPYHVDAQMEEGDNSETAEPSTNMGTTMGIAADVEKTPFSVTSFYQNSHQKLTLFLSGVVLILSLIFYFKKERRAL